VLARSGDVITMHPAAMTICAMLDRLAALPRPRAIERRDDEPLTERAGSSRVAYLLHTNVAIHLRDGDPAISATIAASDDAILLSTVTRVELEGGVYCDAACSAARRPRLDILFSAIRCSPSTRRRRTPVRQSLPAPATRGGSCWTG